MSDRRLLADIGGSSSRWALMDGNEVQVLTDQGAWPGGNITHGPPGELLDRLIGGVPEVNTVSELIAYGAGCGTPERAQLLGEALAAVMPHARMSIRSDLLGVGRALHAHGSGAVLVLGTGMSAGWMKDGDLEWTLPSLGWVLGDEGSGADIGRRLHRDAFRGRMPDPVREHLFGAEGPDLGALLSSFQATGKAAASLASPLVRAHAIRTHPYIEQVLQEHFEALSEILAARFGRGGVMHAAGSIAWAFQVPLEQALSRKGLALGRVIRDPLPELMRFHWPKARA
ncbi:MAG: hypothetical protein KDB88_01440 [Flavobacteriales bacterium]|nr:hypothetical protein [Flavobacteriales bacterium]